MREVSELVSRSIHRCWALDASRLGQTAFFSGEGYPSNELHLNTDASTSTPRRNSAGAEPAKPRMRPFGAEWRIANCDKAAISKALRTRAPCHRLIFFSCQEPADCSHTGGGRFDIKPAAQFRLGGFQQHSHSFSVDLTHTPDVMRKMSFQDELSQNCLFQRGGMPIDQAAGRHKSIHNPRREHDKTKAQRVEEHIRESPDVDNRAGLIQTLECRNWTANVSLLGIVFVLRSNCRHTVATMAAEHGRGYAEKNLRRITQFAEASAHVRP